MKLTYALSLMYDYDAETAGNVINRVWAALERDPEMKDRIHKAAAVEGSNARRIQRAFRELTGLSLVPNPLAYAQGLLGGALAAIVPNQAILALFDSGFFDAAVERYWGLKIKYDDPRGRELYETLIRTHKAEFQLFKNKRTTKTARQPAATAAQRGGELPQPRA